MENTIDIRSLPDAHAYQLLLPDQVAARLQLKQADGNTLFITHENKMQLEWLGQRIWQQYHNLNSSFTASKTRLNRKKRTAVIVLLSVAILAVFRNRLATLLRMDSMYVNAFIFTVAILCGMQLLKYLAMGVSAMDREIASDSTILELKEIIQKDYSPEI
jgi:hypothetical protein